MSHADLEELVASTAKAQAPTRTTRLSRGSGQIAPPAIERPRQINQDRASTRGPNRRSAGAPPRPFHQWHRLSRRGLRFAGVAPRACALYPALWPRPAGDGNRTHELRRTTTADRQSDRRPERLLAGERAPRWRAGRGVPLFARQGHGRTGRRSDGDCARRAAGGPPRRSASASCRWP